MAAYVALFLWNRHLKYTCTFHGLDLVYPNKIYQNNILERIKKFDAVFCVSDYTKQQCIDRGFNEKNLHVVPNGVDFDIANSSKQENFKSVLENKLGTPLLNKKIIVSIGRAVKRKGFAWFAKNILPNLDKNTIYIIAGPIDSKFSLMSILLNILPRSMAKSLKLFTGYASDSEEIKNMSSDTQTNMFHLDGLKFEEIIQLYKHADLMVMPNIKVKGDMEGFGLVALEANLASCPVVVSNIEGITTAVINNRNGIYAESENANSWISIVKNLLEDVQKRNNLARQAKQYVLENYSWDRMTEDYYAVLSNLVFEEQIIPNELNASTKHILA